MSRHHGRHGHSVLDRDAANRPDDTEIQFLAPRIDLFTGGPELHDITPPADEEQLAFADVDDADDGRSRWATVGAATGLLALIVAGVIAAAPWQEDGTAAPPVTSPPPPPSTAGTPTEPTRESMNLPTGPRTPIRNLLTGSLAPAQAATVLDAYLLDPAQLPDRMTALTTSMPSAVPLDEGATGAPDPFRGWIELWATPGAHRQAGSWFSVGWTPAIELFTFENVVRIPLGTPSGETTALLHVDRDGVSTMSYEISQGTATLTWFGRADTDMLALAKGVSFDGGIPRYPEGWAPGELVRLLSRSSVGGDLLTDFVYDRTTATALYELSDGRYLTVTTQDADPDHATVRPFVLTPIRTDPLSGPFVSRMVDGRSVVVGELAPERWYGGQRTNLLEWTEGAVTVQVTADLASWQLLALVPTIRRGTAGEWWEMSTPPPDAGDTDRGGRDESVLLGFGDLGDGGQWFASLLPVEQRVDVSAVEPGDGTPFYFSIDLPAGPCGSAADVSSTLVVCVRSVGTGDETAVETMQVHGDWGTHEVELTQHDPDLRYAIAIARFTEPGPFRVEIVTADGREIRALRVAPANAS